ncbi:uncharacterized protein [Palaemon carinicauda]|uniref:uncharacterized protein n=1 Tax=Palaemon carinicauda TaxID=392227 RepID=UPI0035B5B847
MTKASHQALCLRVVAGFLLALLAKVSSLQYFSGDSPGVGAHVVVNVEGVINASHTFQYLTVKDLCSCRMACWSHVNCMTLSATPSDLGDKFECRLSKTPIKDMMLEPGPQSVLAYWFDKNVVVNHGMQDDGLLYISSVQWYIFNDSLAFCSQHPGFRILMLKTVTQMQVGEELATKINGHVPIDLIPQPDGTFLWGDGTPFNQTVVDANGMAFGYWGGDVQAIIRQDTLHFYTSSSWSLAMCHANPFGVEW